MTVPTVTFAEWLRAEALYASAESSAIAAAWGEDAPKSERITGLAASAHADEEATRQQAFMGVPMAKDQHKLVGQFTPYIGKVITLTCARLGYDAGINVFVLGAADDLQTGLSTVTVLRRLT